MSVKKIRKAGILLNQKKSVFLINEQFPPEIEERRMRLFPIMKQYKSHSIRRWLRQYQ